VIRRGDEIAWRDFFRNGDVTGIESFKDSGFDINGNIVNIKKYLFKVIIIFKK
jgi:hypothetical protein